MIEFGHKCELDPQICDLVPNFEFRLTLVSLPDLDPFFKPTLIHVSIDFEYEPPLLGSHILLIEKECEI